MKLIITLGVQSDEDYTESSRCTIEVSDDAMIATVLEEAKKNSKPMVPNPTLQARLEPHMYLMHPETLEALDATKTIVDYKLAEGSILRLMSGVR
ncbi:MAG: hypothetical protein ACXAEF_07950 [Candidatus Thorarchaeota archaeon]